MQAGGGLKLQLGSGQHGGGLGGGGLGTGLGGGLGSGLKLGGQTPGLGQTGLGQTGTGLSLGGGGGNLTGLSQRPGSLGLGLNQQQQQQGMGLGLNSGLKRGNLEQAGTGLSLGQKSGLVLGGGSGLGIGSGATQTSTGLVGGLGTGLGTGLGLQQQQQQQQLGLGTKIGGGLGTGLSSGLGTGLGGGLGTGQTGLGGAGTTGIGGLGNRLGGLGTGLSGAGMGLGTSTGLSSGLGMGTGNTLGGLSLAGTQKGPAQGIFTQSGFQSQSVNTQQQLISTQLLISAVTMPALFQDERDVIVKKFNQLGAYCGAGTGLASYGGQAQAVEFQPSNPLARFKTICYNRIPVTKNEDGLVGLQFSKECSVLTSQKESITTLIQNLLSGTPGVCVVVDSIRPLPNNSSEMIIYISEQSMMGSTKRVLATTTCMHLQQGTRKSQLESLGVVAITPKTGFSEEDLKAYLSTPPAGISAQVWEQSQKENPDPQRCIPVVVVGSSELLDRVKHQQQQSRQHELRLEIISDELAQLAQAHSTSITKLTEYRRRLNDISHSVLRVMVMQEKLRKCGWSVQTSEEQLRAKLEGIQSELDSPTMLKGRLNELMSQLRLQVYREGNAAVPRTNSKVVLEPALYDDIREHLGQQQEALSQMVHLVKHDMKDLELMKAGLSKEMT